MRNGLLMCCGGCHGGYSRSYRKLPEWESVNVSVRSVYGKTVRFSLLELCRKKGILSLRGDGARVARARWSTQKGLQAALDEMGATRDIVNGCVDSSSAAVIGWEDSEDGQGRLCGDVALTVSVLSRSIGGIYYRNREPDFSFDNLFGRTLIADVPLQEFGLEVR